MSEFLDTSMASLDDIAARLLHGEWLRERGDWRAGGYSWMANYSKRPFDWNSFVDIPGYSSFDWYSGTGAIWDVPTYCTIPAELWTSLDPRCIDTNCWSAYPTHLGAETALCSVIATPRGYQPTNQSDS